TLHESALFAGNMEMSRLLERHGAKVSGRQPEGSQALIAAAMRGDVERVRALARGDAGLVRSHLPMHEAARRDRADVAALLLELGASPDSIDPATGETALHTAAYRESTQVMRLLLDKGARVDVFSTNHGGTALWYALWGNCERACEILGRVSRDVWSL